MSPVSLNWGDYDSDGDLDLLCKWGPQMISILENIYSQDPDNVFVEREDIDSCIWFNAESLHWGDFDLDGDLDILFVGEKSRIYRNNGDKTFTCMHEVIQPGLMQSWIRDPVRDKNVMFPSLENPAGCWADYDNDGDLDVFLADKKKMEPAYASIFNNDICFPEKKPSIPSGLIVKKDGDTLVFSWNRVNNDPAAAVAGSYNIRIGTTPSGSEIVSPMAKANGSRTIVRPGNTRADTFYILRNPVKTKLYWSIQSIDHCLKAVHLPREQSYDLRLNPDITWNEPADIIYGTPLSSLQLNATAEIPGSFVYIPDMGCVLNAGADQKLFARFLPGDTSTYMPVELEVFINVLKTEQEIYFDSIAVKEVGDPDFDPGATASSGLPVAYFISNLQIAEMDDSMVHIISAGTTNIIAFQAGNHNYNPAPEISRTLTVKLKSWIGEDPTADFILYPNPAHNYFYIETSQPDIEIEIVSSTGIIYRKIKPVSSNRIIDVKGMPPGCYMLRFIHDGQCKNYKMVIY